MRKRRLRKGYRLVDRRSTWNAGGWRVRLDHGSPRRFFRPSPAESACPQACLLGLLQESLQGSVRGLPEHDEDEQECGQSAPPGREASNSWSDGIPGFDGRPGDDARWRRVLRPVAKPPRPLLDLVRPRASGARRTLAERWGEGAPVGPTSRTLSIRPWTSTCQRRSGRRSSRLRRASRDLPFTVARSADFSSTRSEGTPVEAILDCGCGWASRRPDRGGRSRAASLRGRCFAEAARLRGRIRVLDLHS